MDIRQEISFERASRHSTYCEGYFATQSPRHMLGISLTTGLSPKGLAGPGSTALAEINAFDLAEVARANLGQLNVITVSSFCGPHGLIWGYDVCAPASGQQSLGWIHRAGREVEIFDLDVLADSFARLVGTVEEKRFPLMPGSHLPAAVKMKTSRQQGVLYTTLGIGIPEDRGRNACLLMEDCGFIPGADDPESHRNAVIESVAQSVLEIGSNHNVRYARIFAGYAAVTVSPGYTGCALVLAPYFLLARDAYPEDRPLAGLTLEQWEDIAGPRFLGRRDWAMPQLLGAVRN